MFAVIGIAVAIYALEMLVFFTRNGARNQPTINLWKPDLFTFCMAGTLITVFLASSFKSMQLSGGGAVVARELHPSDPGSRQQSNVRVEKAIS